jgi:hypothetical protein
MEQRGIRARVGRDGTRGKILGMAVEYWLRILQMDRDELIKRYFEWQTI